MAGDIVKAKVFNCPSCGASLEISALGYTTTVVCKSCKSILDATHPMYKILGQFNEANAYKPLFELGTMGTLRGVKWKIIGFVVRRDVASAFEWNEYLLYNPYKGFRWLLCIDHHFSLTTRLKSIPESAGGNGEAKQINYKGQLYELFNRGSAMVDYVVGEFYWRVRKGEKVEMSDYIAPPFMISQEVSVGEEANWSISEYIESNEVLQAFKTKETYKGYPQNTAANQPNPYGAVSKMVLQAAVAVGVLFVMAVGGSLFHPSSSVVKAAIRKDPPVVNTTTNTTLPAPNYVSESFNIPDSVGNIEVNLFSPIQNQWTEAGITLVNETTGEDFDFVHGVEYYSGVDSDGSWSEGSQSDSKVISSVPGGKYHMEVDLASDMPLPQANLSITRNSFMGANFFIAFILLILPLVWVFWRHRAFEVGRWSQSDFSPYPDSSNSDWGDDDE